MVSIRACFAVIPVALIIVACGGSSSEVGTIADDSGAGTDGTTGNDSAANTDTGTGADTSSGMDASAGPDTAFLGDSALTLDGNDGGGCPNSLGGYSLLVATGLGCGDLVTSAKQCIVLGNPSVPNACFIHFSSEQLGPDRAVNGPNGGGVDLQSDGTFDNAALRLGSINRTGCTGTFDSVAQTMTVTCGGTGTSQSCTVSMVRSSVTCP